MAAWLRWKLEDPFDDNGATNTYEFFPNPNAMTSIHPPKQITASASLALDGTQIMYEGAKPPANWSFSGNILTAVMYEALRQWVQDRNHWVYITDHYGRKMKVYLVNFNPTGKRAMGKAWSHTYQISAYIIGEPGAPTVGEVTGP